MRRADHFAHHGLEAFHEARVVGLEQRQARRCGVATEADQDARFALGHQVKGIAQVQRGNRPSRTLEFAVFSACERDGRAVQLVLDARGENADHALVPGRVVDANAGIVRGDKVA